MVRLATKIIYYLLQATHHHHQQQQQQLLLPSKKTTTTTTTWKDAMRMEEIVVFPTPRHLKLDTTSKDDESSPPPFVLDRNTIVEVTPSTLCVGELLNEFLSPSLGYNLTICSCSSSSSSSSEDEKKKMNIISIDLEEEINKEESPNNNHNNQQHEKEEEEEGYNLQVTTNRIKLRAKNPHGLVHGLQTIRQLLPCQLMMMKDPPPPNNNNNNNDDDKNIDDCCCWSIPCLTINDDTPSYRWRGMHLDVGRHFFSVDFIKRYIDLLAFYKFNVFHWHLTEDQGWRIEIRKHPKLTQISAYRDETPIPSNRNEGDGKPYGGYYTQEQIRDLVSYAQRRYITIVPEIELPGHTVAVLAAYPNLGCCCRGGGGGVDGEKTTTTTMEYKVRTTWGVSQDVFCAGKEEVFHFLEDVLEEVLDLFPGTYIHIGGDECPKDRWKSCPDCQARIKEEGLKDEFELQSWFIRRIEQWLHQRRRKLIGWDEILEGGLSPSATVMSWRGSAPGIEAANAGNDVILTPTSHCYLDYYQTKETENEPPAIGGYLPLERVYELELDHPDLLPEKRHHILGGQGNVWTEYMQTSSQVEYMAFPRAIALSEVLWRHPKRRDFESFRARLQRHLPHLEAYGVHYRPLK